MDRDRKDNKVPFGKIPFGLRLLMWPALMRAPWLLGSFDDRDSERRRDERRRRGFER